MEKEKTEEIELFATINELDMQQVSNVLTENNIPYIRTDDGSGSYMNIYMGQSIQFKRIFVSEADYDKASELIAPFISIDIENDVADAEDIEKYNSAVDDSSDDNCDEETSTTSMRRLKYIVGFLFLGPIGIIILLSIFNLIMSILFH